MAVKVVSNRFDRCRNDICYHLCWSVLGVLKLFSHLASFILWFSGDILSYSLNFHSLPASLWCFEISFQALPFFFRILLSYPLFPVLRNCWPSSARRSFSFSPKFVDPESGFSCVHMMHSVDAFENLFIYNLAHEPKKENHDRLCLFWLVWRCNQVSPFLQPYAL